MSRNDLIPHQCTRCGNKWLSGSTIPFCHNCHATDLFAQLPPDSIAEADNMIYRNMALNAILIFKEAIDLSLKDARDIYEWRAEYLRKHFPERFEKPPHSE